MTTVVLEGDGLDELLARVSSEHGEGARVVRAERVRVGGVGGFFARQRYEVVVEVDDAEAPTAAVPTAAAPTAAAPTAAAPAPASRTADDRPSDVKDGEVAAEDTGEQPFGGPGRPGDRSGSSTQDTAGDSAGEHQHGPRGRDQEETHVLGHSRGPAATAAEVPVPRATADSGRCEEVLGDIFDSPIARALVRANVLDLDANAVGRGVRGSALDRLLDAADAGDDSALGASGTEGAGAVDGSGADGSGPDGSGPDGSGVDGRAGGSSSGPRHAAPAEPLERGRPVSTESAAFAAVLDAVRGAAEPDAVGTPAPSGAPDPTAAEREVPAGPGPEPVAAGAAVAELMALLAARHVAEVPTQDEPVQDEPVQDEPVVDEPVVDERVRDEPSTSPATAPAPAAAPVGAEATTPRARAAAAGLPAPLLARLAADATAGDLHELLEELPPVPSLPGSEGDLVAVVGAPREALVVAKALATRLGLGPEGVLVAACPTGASSPRREVVRDAVAARRAAATVRLGDAPGVVVVQVECDPESVRWARGVVGALQADQVHAVVDATRKSADTERWLDGVFVEDPEAVHVVQAAGSADPATVLGLDLPVASVDGGDGGASAWTSLLTRALPEPVAAEPAAPRRRRRADR